MLTLTCVRTCVLTDFCVVLTAQGLRLCDQTWLLYQESWIQACTVTTFCLWVQVVARDVRPGMRGKLEGAELLLAAVRRGEGLT